MIHDPTPVVPDIFDSLIRCSCGWETGHHPRLKESWNEYRVDHYREVVDTRPMPPAAPRNYKNRPLQTERLFQP